jgi:hypothetical protein
VIEEEVSPRAGQTPGKLAIEGLARFVLDDNLVIGLGTRRER